jgi:multiple sugar transport system substrate-binding protein
MNLQSLIFNRSAELTAEAFNRISGRIMKKLLVLLASVTLGLSLAQTEVRLAGFDGDANTMNGLLEEIVNPALESENITAVFEPTPDFQKALVNGLSAGTAADLFYVDVFWSDSIFDTGKAAALEVDTAAYIPNLVDAFTKDGSVYGVAKDFNTLAIQYNKDIFDEAGVDYPNADDTWDTLKEKLVAIQSSLPDTYGTCVMPDFARFGAFAYATGWQPFDADGKTVLDDNFKRALEFYTGLVADGAGITHDKVGSPGWTGGCFQTDQVAIAIEGAWVGGFLRDQAPNLNYGTAPMPKDPVSGERGNFIYTVSWTVNNDSANKDAALKVLEQLTSPEAQQWVLERGLAIPSRSALSDNEYFKQEGKEAELNRIVFEGATDGNVLPFKAGSYGDEWKKIIDETLNAVLTGEKSVDDAVADAQGRFDTLTAQ